MNNRQTNINDGKSSRHNSSSLKTGSKLCTSRISRVEDDWLSCNSSASSPTTVIRCISPDKSFQHRLRSYSQPIPIHKKSPKLKNNQVLGSSIKERSNSYRNLPHNLQDETTSSGQHDSPLQISKTTVLYDDFMLERQTWNSEETDFKTESSSSIDDTPFIRFAIEQLTRAEDIRMESPRSLRSDPVPDICSTNSNLLMTKQLHTPQPCTQERKLLNLSDDPETYLKSNIITNQGNPYLTPEREREGMALTRKYRSPPSHGPSLSLYPKTRPESMQFKSQYGSAPISLKKQNVTLLPTDALSNPPLTFVPWILRLPSIIILSLMCILMIILLCFCAIFSVHFHRIIAWHGSVSDRQYFLMKFGLPLYAALIFLYLQSVISTITRITPFSTLASNVSTLNRSNAFFKRIYPKLLLPMRVGDIPVDICLFIFWTSVFTIPLQSCLFSLNVTESGRYWVTVQGVAWTLIIIYIFILLASIMSGYLFFHRTTGLLWDPRSLADIISFLPRTNAFQAFSGSDILKTKENIKHKLGTRRWRLGYWKWQNNPSEVFYCLGQEEDDDDGGEISEPTPTAEQASRLRNRLSDLVHFQLMDVERGIRWHDRRTRYRFISWYLRDSFVLLWPVIGSILWLTLVIVFFIPKSAIQRGFVLSMSTSVNKSGFSTAQFLINFGPSALGMLLYLLFQSIEMRLRILKPWAELSNFDGSAADESLLLDYPASPPIYVSLSAFSAAHYRICFMSFLTTLFIILPILSGNIFYPNNLIMAGEIKILANMNSLILLIILLGLYLLGLCLFISSPDSVYLPHDITCLAEITTFLYNSHILEDAAFFGVRSKVDLVTRLMAERTNIGTVGGGINRWAFGVYKGRDGKDSIGIELIGRNPGVGLMVMSAR